MGCSPQGKGVVGKMREEERGLPVTLKLCKLSFSPKK